MIVPALIILVMAAMALYWYCARDRDRAWTKQEHAYAAGLGEVTWRGWSRQGYSRRQQWIVFNRNNDTRSYILGYQPRSAYHEGPKPYRTLATFRLKSDYVPAAVSMSNQILEFRQGFNIVAIIKLEDPDQVAEKLYDVSSITVTSVVYSHEM